MSIGELLLAEPPQLAAGADRFETILSQLHPVDLTREAIVAAFAVYADDHAASSIRQARSTWHGLCKWLIVHREILDHNPIDYIEAPTGTKWRPKPIDQSDLAAVIAAKPPPPQHATHGPNSNAHSARCSSVPAPASPKS